VTETRRWRGLALDVGLGIQALTVLDDRELALELLAGERARERSSAAGLVSMVIHREGFLDQSRSILSAAGTG